MLSVTCKSNNSNTTCCHMMENINNFTTESEAVGAENKCLKLLKYKYNFITFCNLTTLPVMFKL